MTAKMKRRAFITLLGGAAAWPLAARAQQRERMRQVAMIFAVTEPAALAAKSATTTIPIVFATGADPIERGLVASLNHPGANITGVTILTQELIAKRMELLHEIVPAAATIGYLLDPTGSYPEAQTKNAETAARVLGMQLAILNASTLSQIETAFATLVERRIDALMIGNGFVPRNTGEDPDSHKPGHETIFGQFPRLAARHGMPVIYAYREFVDAGGLISYGASLAEQYRLAGTYAGRILRGAKPADLPVVQPTKFEFVINLKTAKALGLTIPETLLATADEVIQ